MGGIHSQDDIEAVFEAAADKLLDAAGRDATFPAYTQLQLARKTRGHEVSMEQVYAEARQIPTAPDSMKRLVFDVVWPDLLKVLSWEQGFVLDGMRQGFTQSELAGQLGVCDRTIREWKTAAFKRVRQSADPYWWPWLIAVLKETFTESYLRRAGRI